jgi:hypothetical protein
VIDALYLTLTVVSGKKSKMKENPPMEDIWAA